MNWLQANITQNPLLIEASRFGRRFVGASKSKRSSSAMLWLCIAIYVTIIAICVANAGTLNAEYVTLFQTFIYCFAVPALTFGAIAGERERRSWDLLIVAPLSKSQIIFGKFLSAAIVVFCIALAFLPLVLVGSISTAHQYTGPVDHPWTVIASESISIGFALALSSIGIFI